MRSLLQFNKQQDVVYPVAIVMIGDGWTVVGRGERSACYALGTFVLLTMSNITYEIFEVRAPCKKDEVPTHKTKETSQVNLNN